MKTLPTQERALRKRQALLDAAAAEFSTIGFEVTTAKSIAMAAGVATGTFYQYFENKNDILRVIANSRFDNLHKRIQLFELKVVNQSQLASLTIEQQFLETLVFVYEFHAQDPELHQVLEQRRSLDFKLEKIMHDGENLLRARVLAFVQTFNIPHSELVADNLFAMAEGLVHRLVFHSDSSDSISSKNSSASTACNDEANKASLAIGAQMLASYFLTQQG